MLNSRVSLTSWKRKGTMELNLFSSRAHPQAMPSPDTPSPRHTCLTRMGLHGTHGQGRSSWSPQTLGLGGPGMLRPRTERSLVT